MRTKRDKELLQLVELMAAEMKIRKYGTWLARILFHDLGLSLYIDCMQDASCTCMKSHNF